MKMNALKLVIATAGLAVLATNALAAFTWVAGTDYNNTTSQVDNSINVAPGFQTQNAIGYDSGALGGLKAVSGSARTIYQEFDFTNSPISFNAGDQIRFGFHATAFDRNGVAVNNDLRFYASAFSSFGFVGAAAGGQLTLGSALSALNSAPVDVQVSPSTSNYIDRLVYAPVVTLSAPMTLSGKILFGFTTISGADQTADDFLAIGSVGTNYHAKNETSYQQFLGQGFTNGGATQTQRYQTGNGNTVAFRIEKVETVPEPSTMTIAIAAGIGALRRRRANRKS